jgi:Fe-coproporphyrin III synthase
MILKRSSYLFLSHLTKQKFPQELIYFVTNRCNSRCRGCFYWQEINKQIRELTLAEIDKISASIGKLRYLMLSGGEPFLRADLPDMLDIFIQNCRPATISIPTNGLLSEMILTQIHKIALRHKRTTFFVSLPLDGLKETNDSLRGKEGSFDAVMKTAQGLCVLKKEHPNLLVFINTTVSNKNYKEIGPLFELVKKSLTIHRHLLQPIRGSLMDKSIVPPTGEDWRKLMRTMDIYTQYYLQKKFSKSATFFYMQARNIAAKVVAESLDGRMWPFDCKAGQSIGVLEPEGSVRLCELTRTIGNVRDVGYDFKKVWDSPEAEKERKKISTRECTQGCTHGCFLHPSLMSTPFNMVKVFCREQKSKQKPKMPAPMFHKSK